MKEVVDHGAQQPKLRQEGPARTRHLRPAGLNGDARVNGGVKTGHRGGAKVGQFGALWSTDFWQ